MFKELIIPNKDKFINFYEECKKNNNYNIGIIGNHGTCKSTLCNIIIKDFLKTKTNYEEDKIIYKLNYYDDINLSNNLNDLNIFCQNNINSDKIVYIDNFDHFNDNNQQILKIYMDKYNLFKEKHKVFFLIESNDEGKIKDIIKFRLNMYIMGKMDKESFIKIADHMFNEKNVRIDEDCLELLASKHNITIYAIKNFLNKLLLLNIKTVNMNIFNENFNLFDYSIFDKYLKYIKEDNIKEANNILFELYNLGYDISDIYFFIYDYIKQENKEEYFELIDIICYYINENYNGNYNKIFLIFLTYDIKKILKK